MSYLDKIFSLLPPDTAKRQIEFLSKLHPNMGEVELNRLVADEFIAVLSQEGSFKSEDKALWKKIVDAIVAFFGGDKNNYQFGEAEKIATAAIQDAAKRMKERAESGVQETVDSSKSEDSEAKPSFRKADARQNAEVAILERGLKTAKAAYNKAQAKYTQLNNDLKKRDDLGNRNQLDMFTEKKGSDSMLDFGDMTSDARAVVDAAKAEATKAYQRIGEIEKALEKKKLEGTSQTEIMFRKDIQSEIENSKEDIRFRWIGKEGALKLDNLEYSSLRMDHLSTAEKNGSQEG